ncbi:hypothetical protein [Devosia riboflavina]|uniref:hypothetical protein n=1 Tax=Devosia riboflavina TaxID=46914 RepID=UPI00068C84CC|nr:hypothetical protein [Devosia riboflavina]
MTTIGMDPGVTGAIAFLTDDGDLLSVVDMPVFAVKKMVKGKERTRNHINVHSLGDILRPYAGAQAVIEDVHSRPDDGGVQAFSFGFGTGTLHGAVGALGMQLDTVAPARWKKHHRLTADKDEARRLATRLWPQHSSLFARKMDAGRAEAALIGRFRIDVQRQVRNADVVF